MLRERAPWWIYALIGCYLVFFLFFSYGIFFPTVLQMSVDLQRGNVIKVTPDGPAAGAGICDGDRLVSVNGRRIDNQDSWDAARRSFEPGRPARLEIERNGQRNTVTVVPQMVPISRIFEPTYFFLFLYGRGVLTVYLVIGIGLLLLRPKDLIVVLFGLVYLATATFDWPVPVSFYSSFRSAPVPLQGLLWVPLIMLPFVPGIWFSACAIFPRPLFHQRWLWAAIWLPAVLLAPFHWAAYYRLIYNPESRLPFFSFLDSWRGFWTEATVYLVGAAACLGANYVRLQDVNERRRVRVVILGFGLLLIAAVVYLGPARFFPKSAIAEWLGSPAGLLLFFSMFVAGPLTVAYAVVRHRLFDVSIVVRRGIQYALARGVVVWMLPAVVALFLLDVAMRQGDIGISAIRSFFAHSQRGWVYAVIGALALLAQRKRQEWLASIDRRFFRERYDAQRVLREVAEEVHLAGGFQGVAPRVVARIEAALHPEFAAILAREPYETAYHAVASAPAGQAPAPLPADSKLMALAKVLVKPLEFSLSESTWLKEQLPHVETEFLRQGRIELLVPVALGGERTEALMVLGPKRSEEPYAREDLDLLVAIAASLALLLEKPAAASARVSETFVECPQCGTCYDTGAGRCAQEGSNLVPVRMPRMLAGRYRLERRRGRGGMGTVYEGADTALERRVAVKVIREDLVGSAEAAERFRREARVAASFTHPNVVTVYDFGVAADTRAFLVMELLEGATLREELNKATRLAPPRVVEILHGVSAAVEAAHRRQLIHRDLKPENIFLARHDGGEIPKVLDFGIAKFLPAAKEQTVDTASGLLVGTVRYMAPEQLRGQAVGPAWDVWGLAVVAYEMLTGAHPFAGSTAAECHAAVLAGRFGPLAKSCPEAPSRWQEFFTQALALDPARRPSSASTFFSELEKALS